EHANVEPAEMEDLEDVRVREELRQIGRAWPPRRQLHHIGGTITRRKLHDPEPVAPRVKPHGLGVDRDSASLVVGKIGQVAPMQADGHCGSRSGAQVVPRRGLEPPRLSPLVPETSASTNSATWALARQIRGRLPPCQFGRAAPFAPPCRPCTGWNRSCIAQPIYHRKTAA